MAWHFASRVGRNYTEPPSGRIKFLVIMPCVVPELREKLNCGLDLTAIGTVPTASRVDKNPGGCWICW